MPPFSFGSSNISGTFVSYVKTICGCSSSGEVSVVVLVGEGSMFVGRGSCCASFIPVDCNSVGHCCGHRLGARSKLEQLANMTT